MGLLVERSFAQAGDCLLYTSDAADERSSVDLGGRRIIKKKNIDDMVTRVRLRNNHRKLVLREIVQ